MTRVFITGCDKKTEWQLPWFKANFEKHMPNENLVVYDFNKGSQAGWFNKPATMLHASKKYDQVCWLDTDCEIRGDISDIWDTVQDNTLGMVEDIPWSMRRGSTWYNSGVVAFKKTPEILRIWDQLIKKNTISVGDQEVLHDYLNIGLHNLMYITPLNNRYNALRLQIQDNTLPRNISVMHWTGKKGDVEIKRQIG